MTFTLVNSFPALSGDVVTEGHARYCRENGHASYVRDGVDQETCPRCGEVTKAAVKRVVVDTTEGRPEARTSYDNKRGLAARDLGGDTLCIHDARLVDGCRLCRSSQSVLVYR